MRTVHAAALVVCIVVLGPATASAGAWVPEPGSGYAKLWTKWLPGVGYHDGAGDTFDYGSYNELFLATYGEYGVVERLAAVWQLDLVRAAWLEDPTTEETSGHATVGDPRLGARLELLRVDRLAMSLEVSGTAPLADDDALAPFVYADGTAAGDLRLGAGVWDVAAAYSAGLGLDGFYTQLLVGYVLRTDGFDDALAFQLEGGADLTDEIAARLRATAHVALEANDAPYRENPAGIGNGVSYSGFALEGEYRLPADWALGLVLEGGFVHIRRQTGGLVTSLYVARAL